MPYHPQENALVSYASRLGLPLGAAVCSGAMLVGGMLPAHDTQATTVSHSSGMKRPGTGHTASDADAFPDLTKWLPDIEAVTVTPPDRPAKISDAAQITMFNEVREGLLRSTGGAKTIGAVALHAKKLEPASTVNASVKNNPRFKAANNGPCYTYEQARGVASKIYADNASGRRILPTVIFDGARICPDETGWVSDGYAADGERPFIAVNNGYKASEILAHEYGHAILGLGHQGILQCDINRVQLEPVQHAITKGGCKPAVYTEGPKKGKIDEYASPYSIMGKTRPVLEAPLLTGSEIARTNRDYKVDAVLPLAGDYELSFQRDKRLGIRFALPANHALRTVVPDAQAIALELTPITYDKDVTYTNIESAKWGISPVVERADNRASLVFSGSPDEPADTHNNVFEAQTFDEIYDYPAVLRDEQLNITAIVSKTDGGYMLHVRNLDDPKVKRLDKIIADEYKRRMAIVNKLN